MAVFQTTLQLDFAQPTPLRKDCVRQELAEKIKEEEERIKKQGEKAYKTKQKKNVGF